MTRLNAEKLEERSSMSSWNTKFAGRLPCSISSSSISWRGLKNVYLYMNVYESAYRNRAMLVVSIAHHRIAAKLNCARFDGRHSWTYSVYRMWYV